MGSVEEARAAAAAGCDIVVAQGVEAGGHVRGRLGLLALLDGVLDAVDVPVVAAGGIATARGVAAVLAAGADAARVGHALRRHPRGARRGRAPEYVEALLAAGGEDTVLTDAYSMMWPAAPHRVLTSCIAAASRSEREPVGETTLGGVTFPVTRWSVVSPNALTTGDIAAMALYAGQGVGAIDRIQSAGEVVAELSGQYVQTRCLSRCDRRRAHRGDLPWLRAVRARVRGDRGAAVPARRGRRARARDRPDRRALEPVQRSGVSAIPSLLRGAARPLGRAADAGPVPEGRARRRGR